MLKKTITYTDYNGVERTEDFYFNLSKGEIIEMELTTEGGYIEMINKITAAQDHITLFKIFKDLILKSYGQKSPDGKRFEKSEKLYTEFAQTEAYSVLLGELCTNAEAAAAFINGVIPSNLGESVKNAEQSTLLTA